VFIDSFLFRYFQMNINTYEDQYVVLLSLLKQILLVKVGQFASSGHCEPPSFPKFDGWLALQSGLLKKQRLRETKDSNQCNFRF